MPPLRRPGACGAGCHRPPCGAECHWRSRRAVLFGARGCLRCPRPAGVPRACPRPVTSGARHTMSDGGRAESPDSPCSPERSTPHREPCGPHAREDFTPGRAAPVNAAAGHGRSRTGAVLLSGEPVGGGPGPAGGPGRGSRGPPRPRRVPVARGGRPITAREHGPWTAARRMRPTAPGSVRTGLPRPVRNTGAGRTGSGRWPFCCPAGPVRRCAAADRGGRPGVGGLLSYTRSRYPFFAPCLNLPRVLSPSCGPAVALPWPSARIGAPSPHA